MTDFMPRPIATPYDFVIAHRRDGHWTARDRGDLAGGTFLTRRDALRFALFETGGDRSHVHLPSSRRRPSCNAPQIGS